MCLGAEKLRLKLLAGPVTGGDSSVTNKKACLSSQKAPKPANRKKTMATIYKHSEIGQIERLTHKLCYCLDGKILRNQGAGWKIYGKLKPGIDPQAHFEKARANYAEKLATKPAFAAWRREVHKYAFSKRGLLVEMVKTLGNDIDGLWVELNDLCGIHASLDDCQALVDKYNAAIEEGKLDNQSAKV